MKKHRKMKKIFNQKKVAVWVVATLALLMVVSCKDDKETVSGFTLNQTEAQFVNNGGVIELNIATDQEWTAITDADWCMVTPATGVGSGVCVIKADSSYLYKERVGKVRFYAGNEMKEVVIKQFGYAPVIEFTSNEVSIPSYAPSDKSFIDVEASSNIPFEVEIPVEDQAWLTIEGATSYEPSTTIPRKQKFRFKFKTYTEFKADRVANVAFKEVKKNRDGTTEVITQILKIVQEAAPKIVPSREGDSLAILSIARVLGMGGELWPTSRPMIYWDDVEMEERTFMYDDGEGTREERTELRVISVRYFMFDSDEGIPYQVKFLSELETLIVTSNSNAFMRKIDLGPEITELTKLKSLSLMGYGIRSLPEQMGNMVSLEELDLNGNNFLKLPLDILYQLPSLKYLNFGGNRISGNVVNLQTDIPKDFTLETIGMGGEIPSEIFRLNQLEYLNLSYNYFYGSIPAMEGETNVMPNLKALSLNLNRLTGDIPDWILKHKRLGCWNPYMLIFTQEGRDHMGRYAVFNNEPSRLPDCPDWNEEDEEIASRLPKLTTRDKETGVPLHGNWRYYNMLTK